MEAEKHMNRHLGIVEGVTIHERYLEFFLVQFFMTLP